MWWLFVALTAVSGGFFVALFTGWLQGKTRVHRRPGGSLAAGIVIAMTAMRLGEGNPGLLILGGLCGVAGWALYLGIYTPRDSEEG